MRAATSAPQVVTPPGPVPIMVIAAHPDDLESWCAGTLALAIAAGATVRLLLLTSGEKGTANPQANPHEIALQREAEAQEAAARLGLAEVVFLCYPDGELEETRELRRVVVAWIRCWQPAVLFTHDPEYPDPPYLSHRDHRVTGRTALDAVYPLARDPLAFPEQLRDGLAPHKVRQVWLFASATAPAYLDIRTGFERKLAARLAHASQTADPTALKESWRKRAAAIGAPLDLPLAEAFTLLQLE